jgi:hypothetical protein
VDLQSQDRCSQDFQSQAPHCRLICRLICWLMRWLMRWLI